MIPLAVDTSLLTAASAAGALLASAAVALDAFHGRKQRHLLAKVRTRSVALEALPSAGLDPSFLIEGAERERPVVLLERAIAEGDLEQVRDQLATLYVYVLGHMVRQVERRQGHTVTELLQVEAIDEQSKGLVLPVFTRQNTLRDALLEHPDWQAQSVIELKGSELLRVIASETGLLIDPWSRREFALPPKAEAAVPPEVNEEGTD